MPLSLKGISICGHRIERTPFWPCLLENLSPMTGFLGNLSVTLSVSFASFDPFPLDVPDKLSRLNRQIETRVRHVTSVSVFVTMKATKMMAISFMKMASTMNG
jgi:hypothetical protein